MCTGIRLPVVLMFLWLLMTNLTHNFVHWGQVCLLQENNSVSAGTGVPQIRAIIPGGLVRPRSAPNWAHSLFTVHFFVYITCVVYLYWLLFTLPLYFLNGCCLWSAVVFQCIPCLWYASLIPVTVSKLQPRTCQTLEPRQTWKPQQKDPQL